MKITLPRLIIAVLFLWAATPIAVYSFIPDWTKAGPFGDVFGSANALFSGLAFAGLYWALQQTELSLQREELRLQREEMAASRRELANQVEAQQALFRASAAQIAVAAAQARIEALKIDSEQVAPSGRTDYVRKIEAIASALDALGNRVELSRENQPAS